MTGVPRFQMDCAGLRWWQPGSESIAWLDKAGAGDGKEERWGGGEPGYSELLFC